MIIRKNKYIMAGIFFLSFVANSDEVIKSSGNLDIPYSLITEGYESDIIISGDKITILAKKGTDLYTNADGSNSNDNAPRIFFEPKSDFTLSAKVIANFTTAYDGGALFLYADTDNWGKLLFERFKSGDNGIASTVTRLTGDDAYHYLVENNYIYFKIVRKNNKFTFLYSESGEQWLYLRSFSLTTPKPIKVGFIAQSPISKNHKVVYSNILFKE
jgi:regulation of enolase protein 1 (concanavalin A-like superfamily)